MKVGEAGRQLLNRATHIEIHVFHREATEDGPEGLSACVTVGAEFGDFEEPASRSELGLVESLLSRFCQAKG